MPQNPALKVTLEESFMENLLSELRPVLSLQGSANSSSSPAQCASDVVESKLALKPKGRFVKPKPAVTPTLTLSNDSSNVELDQQTNFLDLLDGIEDWGNLSPDEDAQQAVPLLQENDRLSQQYWRCQIHSLDEAPRWNLLNKRMERNLKVGFETLPPKTLILCDEWCELPLEVDNSLNIVSLPNSTPIDMKLETLVFSSSEPGHLLILFPSVLISATTVSNSISCSRRSALTHRLKTSSNELGEAVVRGNIVHEVIQNLLLSNDKYQNKAFIPSSQSVWQLPELTHEARKACVRNLIDLFMVDKTIDQGVEMAFQHLEILPNWSKKYLAKPEVNGQVILDKEALLIDPRSNVRQDAQRPRIGITGVIDIEEEIWSPKYGLKGKIDATVQASIIEEPLKSKSFKISGNPPWKTRIFPLEIKTGRKPSGIEHIAQTMLYTLLLSDRYNTDITAGLLLYTSFNELTRVRAVNDEIRHLIIARNHLASYTNNQPSFSAKTIQPLDYNNRSVDVEDLISQPVFDKPLLPPPIDNDHACGRCYAIDSCFLYRKTVERVDSLPSGKSTQLLSGIYQQKTGHLSPVHTDFFRRWEALISLEECEVGKMRKDIWEMGAEKRQDHGYAFADMVIDYRFDIDNWLNVFNITTRIHRYVYCLTRASPMENALKVKALPFEAVLEPEQSSRSLLLGRLAKHDPIVVSIEGQKLAFAHGFILELTSERVIVGLNHRLEEVRPLPIGANLHDVLTQHASNEPSFSLKGCTRYRIDKDELITGLGRARDNLIQVFLKHSKPKLLELVVDLRKPEFDMSVDSFGNLDDNALNHLNIDQKNVIRKALYAKDYALILGMPGTGKTTTVTELVKFLVKAGKTILLTSYTHSAVDNILVKLIPLQIKMLRLGKLDKISPVLHPYALDELAPAETVDELEWKLMTPQLVATTSLSINHPVFSKRNFDYCIVDEASQITLPTCLGPLRYADVFVLVGDHFQLPPLVKSVKARAAGLETSLFKLLTEAHPESVVSLSIQYRMNEDIMSLSNALIYDGRMRCANKSVAELSLNIPHGINAGLIHDSKDPVPCIGDCWLSNIMQPERKVVFVNVDQLYTEQLNPHNILQNECEAGLVFQLVAALMRCGVATSTIGILTPYRQQIKLLGDLFEDVPDLEILTADKYQGRDKDCIIMTMVRSKLEEHVGELLKDWRRINVCLTRAKKKLVIFGSKQILQKSAVLNDFFKLISHKQWVHELEPGSEKLHGSLSSFKIKNAYHFSPESTLNNIYHSTSSTCSKRQGDFLQPSINKSNKRPRTIANACKKFGVLRDVTIDFLEDNSS
ncbi:hypothetical protein O181_002582 [Austropuccinia psidii MF-1]|uniref:DNA replication ATP-dependent helicase/nuclease n=1 Tax=Austropuccinia psidii MF-1 TaxID=1389203 RepID=A0A9Q3GE38_9BASI|nr:hypothetical protein [Austropuccinia psidii MF-1]